MEKFKAGTKFSDVINMETVAKWDGNVVLDGGTGTGKTYFILHTLVPHAVENDLNILFLCNRTALFDAVTRDIQIHGITNIDVMTYQLLEKRGKENKELISFYDYVVCDEFHHVNEIYNIYTDVSFKWIMETYGQKIFMSATCHNLFSQFLKEGIVTPDQYYYIDKDYSYVKEVKFFSKKNTVFDIITDKLINNGEKIIYFAGNMENALKVYQQFEDVASFYCSKHTKNQLALKYLEDNKDAIHNETFDGQLLVATKALDVGITLKDESIKHIISDVTDVSSMIQCLGRKRVASEKDSCTFYLRNFPKRELNMLKKEDKLKPLRMFRNNRAEFDIVYGNDRSFHSDYIYFNKDNVRVHNELAYQQLHANSKVVSEMQRKGYKNYILNVLGDSITNVIDMDEEKKVEQVSELEMYLNSIVGTEMLTKDDRTELIKKMNIRQNGKLLKSASSLNSGMNENNYNFYIKEFETSRMIEGKKKKYKSVWKVMRLIEE